MDIPFKLNIFKQIEFYQDLRESDSRFLEQLKKYVSDKKDTCIPLWFFEKKILYWVYKNHKHLGSPIKLSSLTNREVTYSYLHGRTLDEISEEATNSWPLIEKNLRDMNVTPEEGANLEWRKAIGNLEVNGLVKFYLGDERDYKNIHQGNCEGFFITPKGFEYAKMIHYLYDFKKVRGDYLKVKGLKKILELKNWQVIKFTIIVTMAWFAIILSALLIIKHLAGVIADPLAYFLN